MTPKLLIGSQAPNDSKGLLDSIKDVVKNGGNVVQIFLRNMCTTSQKGRKEISSQEEEAIKKYKDEHDLSIFVHGSYLLNFCKIPVGLTRIQWAYKLLADDMIRASRMGLNGVVIHMCSMKAVDEKWKPFQMSVHETEQKMIDHIIYFFRNFIPKDLKGQLLLENSASRKTKIGGTIQSLGAVVKPLRRKYGKRIGVCLDTCHAFASGYPLNTIDGARQLFTEFKKFIGPYSILSLIHLNDSSAPLGSNIDNHAPIGKGLIFKTSEGKKSLRYIVDFAIKHKIPLCLETHSDYKSEIKIIKSLATLKHGGGSIPIDDVIHVLEEFQAYHKSLGNDREATQYGKAIASIRSSNIKRISSGNELVSLPWVGKGIAKKIDEFIKTGKVGLLEEFKNDPKVQAFRELNQVFGVGPKKAMELVRQGVRSVNDLKKKVKNGNIRLTRSQSLGLKYYHDLLQRIPRKESEQFQKIIEDNVRDLFEGQSLTILAGSYHMEKKSSGDVDIVVSLKKYRTHKDLTNKKVLQDLVRRLYEKKVLLDTLVGSPIPKESQTTFIGIGKIKRTARHIDIHVVGWDELPFHMLYFGSGERFSRQIRAWASSLGYKLSDKGLFKNDIKVKNIKNEKDIFKTLKIKWVPPSKRELGEIKSIT